MSVDLFKNTIGFDSPLLLKPTDADIKSDVFYGPNIGLAVNIQELKLVTVDGLEIDLLNVYDGIGIKEGIYTTAIHGMIRIFDPAGGLEKFALRGGERLFVKISKPNSDVIIWRRDLIVTKIGESNFDIMNYKTAYNLYFASSSFIFSMKKTMYTSFKEKSISDVVLETYKEMSTNTLFIEDPKLTLGNTAYQCSGKMPHEVIVDMTKRACSKNRFFVFFERFIPVFGRKQEENQSPFSASHYFGSIEKLIEDSEKKSIQNIFFIRDVRADVEPNYIRAFSLKRLESFRHLEATKLGFYGTEFCSINIINRKCKNQQVGYLDADNTNLYPNKFVDQKNIFSQLNKNQGEIPGKKVFVSSVNDPVNRESWLAHEHIKRIETVYFRVSIEIAGATNNIGVGHVINLLVPSSAAKMTQPASSIIRYDPIHSGKYIVTGVDHIIRNGQYIKTLELSRDSLPFSYENTTDDTFIINNIESFITGKI